jgi:hypothetical protein
MSLFGQNPVTITIDRDRMRIDSKSHGIQEWVYPAGSIINLEVREPETFLQSWQQVWQNLSITNAEVLIVLSDSVVFSKTVDSQDQSFFQEVPIETSQMTGRAAFVNGKYVMLATNGTLVSLIAQAIDKSGSHVTAAVPAGFTANKQLIKEGNFLGPPNQTN